MAKISGFLMSTLLIVLCLWINVCHYPDATVALERRSETLVVPCDAESSEPASVPVESPSADESNEAEDDSDATVAETNLKPAWIDASASRSDVRSEPDPASKRPVLEPASFPAEIDDSPRPNAAEPTLAPTSFEQTPDAAPSVSDADSATKPRGAKYVRVPEVEIDAFSGGIRVVGATLETRESLVGATRAEQTTRSVATVR